MMPREVHQIVPYLAYGDAVGNQILELRRALRQWGYRSEIFAEHWDPRVAHECHPYREYKHSSHPDNLLILHYATAGQVNQFVLQVPDQVIIYYHNITPAHFFLRVNTDMVRWSVEGRRDLNLFVGKKPAIAASPYNAIELQKMGFQVLGVAPYILNHERLDAGLQGPGAAEIAKRFSKQGKRDWLYVGRIAPNKCIHDIIKAFYYYHTWIDPQSRLLLVGASAGMELYVKQLCKLIKQTQLEDAVIFAGHHGAADGLAVFYRMADLYLSMSEHEGFCVPLVEAMYYSVPVIAYASTGVPYTMGDAGILIREKDYPVIAEAAFEVISNEKLREQLLSAQQARVEILGPEAARVQFRVCLEAASR